MAFILLCALVLIACSQTDAVPSDGTDTSAEPTVAVRMVSEDLERYLPSADAFQDSYSSMTFPITNESLVDNWGADYQQILDQLERQEGVGAMYNLESPEAQAPAQILVVIERFSSAERAGAFMGYDFPDGFRQGIYDGQPIDVGSAQDALLTTIRNPRGDDPNASLQAIVCSYQNTNVIVQGQGTADTVTQTYLEPIALTVLENLAAGE
jgi:hypothetical protein